MVGADTARAPLSPPMPASPTAACVAGEARAFVLPAVHGGLRAHVLEPLRADAFVVVSRRWSRGWHAAYHSDWSSMPEEVSPESLSTAIAALRPKRSRVMEDESLFAGGLSGWRSATERFHPSCTSSQAPWHFPGCSNATGSCTEAAFFGVTCMAQLALARRWQLCLELIGEVEVEERQLVAYSWVTRLRPDSVLPCRLRLQDMAGLQVAFGNGTSAARPWAAFIWDYLAWMPRAVANVSLRQAVHGLDVAYCRDFRQRPEFCNHCLLMQRGVGVLRLTSIPMEVSRGCQTLSEEKAGKRCKFLLPGESAASTAAPLDDGRGAYIQPNASARAPACAVAGKRVAWKFTCRLRSIRQSDPWGSGSSTQNQSWRNAPSSEVR